MSGLRLVELEASDMLDVLHFLFEEDNIYSSEEQMRSRSGVRESIYEKMYGTKYKYKVPPPKNQRAGRNYVPPQEDLDLDGLQEMPEEEAIKPFNPRAERPKDYVAPTQFNPAAAKPFGNILDAPMG